MFGLYRSNLLFGPLGQWGMVLLFVWSLIWKSQALWQAARRNEKWWFGAFLIIQTVGILEIIYLLFVVKYFSQHYQCFYK